MRRPAPGEGSLRIRLFVEDPVAGSVGLSHDRTSTGQGPRGVAALEKGNGRLLFLRRALDLPGRGRVAAYGRMAKVVRKRVINDRFPTLSL